MAELLIMARDNSNPDPNVDARCYKKGDIVVIMPDGHKWGREEGPPTFHVVKLPRVPPDEIQGWLKEETNSDGMILRRRTQRLPIEKLPQGERAKLERGEAASIGSLMQATLLMERKVELRGGDLIGDVGSKVR